MKRLLLLLLLPVFALATPPYDVEVTFGAVTDADGYNLYVDDCAGAPSGAGIPVVSGQSFPGLLTADGTYDFCVRAYNLAGVQPDPGQVVNVTVGTLNIPETVDDTQITIVCDPATCVVTIVIQ